MVPSNSELVLVFRFAKEDVTGANEGDVKSLFAREEAFLGWNSDHPKSIEAFKLASTEEDETDEVVKERVP